MDFTDNDIEEFLDVEELLGLMNDLFNIIKLNLFQIYNSNAREI